MRRLDSGHVFLAGLGLIGFAFCFAVGSGFKMHVEHDNEHFWIVVFSAIAAVVGLVLIGISLWPVRNVPLWQSRPSSGKKPFNHELD